MRGLAHDLRRTQRRFDDRAGVDGHFADGVHIHELGAGDDGLHQRCFLSGIRYDSLHFDVAQRLCTRALDDIVPFPDRGLHPQPRRAQFLARRAHVTDEDQPVAAIGSRRLTILGARHAGIKTIRLGVTLHRVLDHCVDAGIPLRVSGEILQIAAGFLLNVVIHLVVGGENRFRQILLVEIKGALGIFRLLLDLQSEAGGFLGLFPQTLVGTAKGGVVGASGGEADVEAEDVASRAHFGGGPARVQHGQRHLRNQSSIGARAFGTATGSLIIIENRLAGEADHLDIAFGGAGAILVDGGILGARHISDRVDVQIAQARADLVSGAEFAFDGAREQRPFALGVEVGDIAAAAQPYIHRRA